MKVKVIKNAYYNNEFIKTGRIIDFKGKTLPSWATLADGVETKKNEQIKNSFDNTRQHEEKELEKTPVNADEKSEEKMEDKKTSNEVETPEASPDEIEYLNKLIDEGIERGKLIEDADKKTVKEQIKELETALNK